MRIRKAFVVIVVTLAGAASFSITGQEEPLPPVQQKGVSRAGAEPTTVATWRGEPTVFLAVEPIRELAPLTLAEAAKQNDYVSFHNLFVTARNRGEDVSAYEALHELWTWSMNDPIGAFYGAEIHDRLARAFPGYAAYIEAFRIVDRKGNAFYPTAETRSFLLERATRGETTRVIIAKAEPAPAQKPARAATSADHSSARSTRSTTRDAARVKATPRTSTPRTSTPRTSTSKPATVASTTAASHPATVPAKPAEAPAQQQQSPSTITAPAVQQPVASQPIVAQEKTPAATATQAAEAQQAAPGAPEPAPASAPAAEANDLRNRGILLLIIGLLGTGILAVILRASKEQPTSIIQPADKLPPNDKVPAAGKAPTADQIPPAEKVHPIRPAPTSPDEHRATGSRR